MIASPVTILLLSGCGLYGAWSDIRHRRLSNWLAAVTASCGLGLTLLSGGIAACGSSLLHVATALLIGLPLFALKLVGGGDVKFYAAMAAWFPFGQGFRLLAFVSIAGMIVTLSWLTLRWLGAGPEHPSGVQGFDNVPFGVAIAGGAVMALAWP